MTVIPFPTARPASLVQTERPAVSPPAPWLRRLRHRRALAGLVDAQIREAGLDPFQVRAEILKPFWRA